MPDIQIQFSTEANIASRVCHYYDHVWCSHVDAVMPNGGLLGAKLLGGVKIRPNLGFTKTLLVELPTTQTIYDKFYGFLRDQLGKPYDLSSVFAFAFERDVAANDSWFCSELIAVALDKSEYLPYSLFSKYNKITPGNLLFLLNAFVFIHEPVVLKELYS